MTVIKFFPRDRWVEWSITIQQCTDGQIRFQIHDLDDPETPEQARRIAAALEQMQEHLEAFANGEQCADATQANPPHGPPR